MANKNDDIEIKVDGDPVSAPEIEIRTEDTSKKAIPGEDGIEELKKKLFRAEKDRENAIAEADAARKLASMNGNEADKYRLATVEGGIANTKRDIEVLKQTIQDAVNAADGKMLAEAQHLLSVKINYLQQMEMGKEQIEANVAQSRAAVADPVEDMASRLSSKSAAWIRAHPEYARNPVLTNKMIAAHNLVTSDGIAAESDQYFQEVENILKISRNHEINIGEDIDPMSESAKPTQRRTSVPAAPVSRTGTPVGQRKNVVTLSTEEREFAAMNGMTEKEYAQNKLKLIEEGRLSRH